MKTDLGDGRGETLLCLLGDVDNNGMPISTDGFDMFDDEAVEDNSVEEEGGEEDTNKKAKEVNNNNNYISSKTSINKHVIAIAHARVRTYTYRSLVVTVI